MATSVINLILSIFGICVSSIFILFWCGRFLCSHFLFRRTPGPGAGALWLSRTATNRRVVERNSTGVSPLVIAYFPTIRFNENMLPSRQDAMCAVCLGEYKEDELLRCLPQCGHNFHVNCIDAWLQQHATCPVCRMSLQGLFVGRLTHPLQSIPLLTDHLRAQSRNASEVCVAGSSGLVSAGGSLSGGNSASEDSLVCNGGPELSGSVLQSTERQTTRADILDETGRMDSHAVDLGPIQLGDRS